MCAIKWGGSVSRSCWPHARGTMSSRCSRPRAPSARWGTCGAWIHESRAHSGLLWIPPLESSQSYISRSIIALGNCLHKHSPLWGHMLNCNFLVIQNNFCRMDRFGERQEVQFAALAAHHRKNLIRLYPQWGGALKKYRVACLLIVCLSIVLSIANS